MRTFIKNCWASNARPLASLRELLARPPMTQQERNRQTLTEARSEMPQLCTGSTGPLFRGSKQATMCFVRKGWRECSEITSSRDAPTLS
jgi:hypothetical protein